VTPAPSEDAHYDARWGYRSFDARRYEQRRYGGIVRQLNHGCSSARSRKGLSGVRKGGVVLDAPCGTGVLATSSAARLPVLGADISPAMLDVARERGPVIGHVRADLERPPLRPGSVDAVVSTRFLMHLPAELRPRVLASLARLSRGPVVATVCHPYTFKTFGGRSAARSASDEEERAHHAARARSRGASAGLRLERVIPVMPILSEVWVIVVHATPGAA
jgi:SAM-dependent methyltransferase